MNKKENQKKDSKEVEGGREGVGEGREWNEMRM